MRLHKHLVPGPRQRLDAHRHDPDPILIRFHFLGNSNTHKSISLMIWGGAGALTKFDPNHRAEAFDEKAATHDSKSLVRSGLIQQDCARPALCTKELA
jgi:hypothetical protein